MSLAPQDWIQARRDSSKMEIKRIQETDCSPWVRAGDRISRPDSRFFSIFFDGVETWIDQPEVGVLGLVFHRENGKGCQVLIQAKEEPGNVGLVQLAPTVQSTQSNQDMVHGGSPTKFLEFFTGDSTKILWDSLQSEQGTKFWKKKNRNVAVVAKLNQKPPNGFAWFGLGELLDALHEDYLVNTDLRSCLATGDWLTFTANIANCSSAQINKSNFGNLLRKNLRMKIKSSTAFLELDAIRKDTSLLQKMEKRQLSAKRHTNTQKSENVGFFHITKADREISEWRQPLYEVDYTEEHTLYAISGDGELFFVLEKRFEAGLLSIVEFGPSHSKSPKLENLSDRSHSESAVVEFWIQKGTPVASIWQSDEGGRFFQNNSRYSVIHSIFSSEEFLGAKTDLENLSGYALVTATTLNEIVKAPLSSTNELRTLCSLLLRFLN